MTDNLAGEEVRAAALCVNGSGFGSALGVWVSLAGGLRVIEGEAFRSGLLRFDIGDCWGMASGIGAVVGVASGIEPAILLGVESSIFCARIALDCALGSSVCSPVAGVGAREELGPD